MRAANLIPLSVERQRPRRPQVHPVLLVRGGGTLGTPPRGTLHGLRQGQVWTLIFDFIFYFPHLYSSQRFALKEIK